MAEFKNIDTEDIKTIKLGDTTFKVMTEEDEKNLKGYQYDSLVYRYIRARERMAEYEALIVGHNRSDYFKQADRDIMRFIQILNEMIGEHN